MDATNGNNPNVGLSVLRVDQVVKNPMDIPQDLPEMDIFNLEQIDRSFSALQQDMPMLQKEFWIDDTDSDPLYIMRYGWSAAFETGTFYLSFRALENNIVNKTTQKQRQTIRSSPRLPLIKDILLSGNQLIIKVNPVQALTRKEKDESNVQEKFFSDIMESPLEAPLNGLKRRRDIDLLNTDELRDVKRQRTRIPNKE